MAAHGFTYRSKRAAVPPASRCFKSRETCGSTCEYPSAKWSGSPRVHVAAPRRISRNCGVVTNDTSLANRRPCQRGDCHQLSGSANAAGGNWRDTKGYSYIESNEGAARLGVPADLRPDVCGWRAVDGSARHAARVFAHHDFLVAGVCEPRICGWSCDAGGEPV